MTVTPEQLAEDYPELLFCDGHDNALIGVAHRFGMEPVALYNRAQIIQNLMVEGMTWEEAEEFFGYNIIGGWHGEMTPVFAELPTGLPPEPVTAQDTIRRIDNYLGG